MRNQKHLHALLLTCLVVLAAVVPQAHAKEIEYPSKAFAQLDTFEAVAVEDADKLFLKKDYRGAFAAYKAYTFEFAQGRALPYVLLRMGRCLHLSGKRNTAIKAYQDVVDYFPNDVRYAAAAMYYIGQCHAQNGNEDAALAAWAKLAKEKDYVKEPLSGTALVSLATAMSKRGEHEEATRYRWQTAVDFAKSNERASRDARDQVVYHYVVRSPNQTQLLKFCNEVGGFGWRHNIDKPADSPTYWHHVLDVASRSKLSSEKRNEVMRYWDSQMGDRFADDDSLRIKWFNLRLAHDGDVKAWAQRVDEQFKRKPVTVDRIKRFLPYYNNQPKMRSAFFQTHAQPLLSGLDNAQKIDLMKYLRHPMRMDAESIAVMRTVKTNDMTDEQLRDFALFIAGYNTEEEFLRVANKIKDKTAASKTRFDYYYARAHRNGDFQQKALAEIPTLKKSPDLAQQIVWPHAELRHWQGEHEEAIKLYRSANRQPQSTWAIIDCRLAMKQYEKAIQLTKELESIGGSVASQACLRAADIYRMNGNKGKEVQQLQLVLRRYPGTKESSNAHNRLESYGIKLIGGEAVAED